MNEWMNEWMNEYILNFYNNEHSLEDDCYFSWWRSILQYWLKHALHWHLPLACCSSNIPGFHGNENCANIILLRLMTWQDTYWLRYGHGILWRQSGNNRWWNVQTHEVRKSWINGTSVTPSWSGNILWVQWIRGRSRWWRCWQRSWCELWLVTILSLE